MSEWLDEWRRLHPYTVVTVRAVCQDGSKLDLPAEWQNIESNVRSGYHEFRSKTPQRLVDVIRIELLNKEGESLWEEKFYVPLQFKKNDWVGIRAGLEPTYLLERDTSIPPQASATISVTKAVDLSNGLDPLKQEIAQIKEEIASLREEIEDLKKQLKPTLKK